jgi:hypothetical protein
VRDLRKADGDCSPLAGGPLLSVLQKRVEALEAAAAGGDGGCGRCRGDLVLVKSGTAGALHSARWNSEALTEDGF